MKADRNPPLGSRLVREWLRLHGLTARSLAASLEVDEATVSRWLNGALMPSKVSRLAMEHITQGAAPAAAWLEP